MVSVVRKYYFDYASCTPITEEIIEQYMMLLKQYFVNSESVYQDGLEVYELVETSRKKIAKLLGVLPQEVLFMSGASEANSFAIKGYAQKYKYRGKHIIANKMEHSSVINALKQLVDEYEFEVTFVDVDKSGVVSLDEVKKRLRKDTIMVCLMSINNEIGSIQPVEEIAQYVKENTRAAFMCDAVQSIGKTTIDLNNIDLFTFTMHKIYGVKGCGILIKKSNLDLLPLIHGGQQEQGLRGGTLNAPACIIAAKTLRLALADQEQHTKYVVGLNQKLRQGLKQLKDVVVTSDENCSPYIVNFSCTSIGSEIMMNALNAKHIYVSAQSTCSSRTKAPSHTLTALGYSEAITYGAIRVSMSHLNKEEEIDYLLKSLEEIIYEYRT